MKTLHYNNLHREPSYGAFLNKINADNELTAHSNPERSNLKN